MEDKEKSEHIEKAEELKEDQTIQANENAIIDKTVTFKSLGLWNELWEAWERLGYKHPSKIQKEAIPFALKGKDIIGLAETGSGKTAAFGLPILQDLLNVQSPFFALILSPTRELCIAKIIKI